ncbi:transcriptional regulator [Streptomyces sp. TRM49041]|uniref:transcriptional regulator n=1 Tax=Streptomyces sp. TRM49041 TaxID=2603216 RepID=UPI0011EC48B3|nr:transcriptional regulator [Streptomyces sp. TRM49041]
MTGVVSPMLRRLATDGATGALVRDHGTLYLVDGHVVHAESPVAPGPDVLLTGGSDRRALARSRGGRIGDGEREICRLGALFDAAFFALAPGRGPARFRYGAEPRQGGAGRPVPAAAVERETLRRRELLDSVWPYPALDGAPVVPRPAAPGQAVTARGRALLARADGVRTPAQLAWVLGRPAFHTVLEVRRLAAAGLVETPHEPGPPPGPAPPMRARAPARAPAPPPAPPTAPLPPPAPWAEHLAAEQPDIALLRRVRDALEARL